MKWTLDWLQEYLKTNASAVEIADTLTRIGLEIEELSEPKSPIAAKIIECRPHENSDHLHVLRVDDGSGELRQVVCGAPNARAGLISALAVPGCVIDGHEIQSGKLRGVLSDGMMCSERELGIGDDHSGIIELSPDTVIGTPVIDAKTVFDAGITPNRPDYLSVRGIARDLYASGIGEFIAGTPAELANVDSARHVNVKTDKCNVYRFCEIHGITIANSNKTIAARLAAIEINPKNAPVDATNYVCYDMGQPLHCFDADEIHGDITVRMATPGEGFTDLFGVEHKLQDTDIVIADNDGVLALAGVIGGMRGATTQNTKNIILESAYFDPVSVRKTSKRLGISTDASYRYERGIDPTITASAIAMAARIIMDACGGEIVGTGIGGKNVYTAPKIEYFPDIFYKKIGFDINPDEQMNILKKLGYDIQIKGGKWIVTPPSSRVDVMIPETIVADLIRIYGYDKIESVQRGIYMPTLGSRDTELDLKRILAARGLNECVSFGFGNSVVESLLSDVESVKIANPITNEMDTMRNSLIGNILLAVSYNEKHGYADLSLFESGVVFDGDTPGKQHNQICIVRSGQTSPRHWLGRSRPVDVYDVKADLIALMRGMRYTMNTDNTPRWAHPFRYGAMYQGRKKIAEFGQLHPMVARALRIKTNVVIGVIDDIANLPVSRKRHAFIATEFQPVSRDFAFIVDSDFPADKIVAAASGADNRISDVVVFDSFDMGDGKKSVAFTITILPTENMSDTDLNKIQDTVIGAVETKCGAKIRDK